MPQTSYRFQFLAPRSAFGQSRRALASTELYGRYLKSLQELRGRTYLQDGAIQPWQLDASDCHRMNDDERCWHFLLVDRREHVVGCARYLLHSSAVTVDQLRISRSPLAQHSTWRKKLHSALRDALLQAQKQQIGYAELGGWALAREYRNTKAALEILLGSYLWAEMVGHCLCSCTATIRNHSSSILRRIGATSLMHGSDALPPYFDPQYRCTMELLGFDSRRPPSRFTTLLNEMRPKLARSPIITGASSETTFSFDLARLQAICAASHVGIALTTTPELFIQRC